MLFCNKRLQTTTSCLLNYFLFVQTIVIIRKSYAVVIHLVIFLLEEGSSGSILHDHLVTTILLLDKDYYQLYVLSIFNWDSKSHLGKLDFFSLGYKQRGPNWMRGLRIFSPKYLLQEHNLKFSTLDFSHLKNMTCQLIILEFLISTCSNFTTSRTRPIVYGVKFHCLLLHQMSV